MNRFFMSNLLYGWDWTLISGATQDGGTSDVLSDKGRVMVETIIKIAQSLGLHTIAEGVETESQLAELRAMGCGEIQGFLLSKPLPAEQIEELLGKDSRHSLIDQVSPVNNFVI